MKNSIRKKVSKMICNIAMSSTVILGITAGIIMGNMRSNSQDSILEQKQDEIFSTAEGKGEIAERSLNMILNQTRSVMYCCQTVYGNKEDYLNKNITDEDLTWIDFYHEGELNTYSKHIRAPRELLTDITKDTKEDKIIAAKLDYSKLTQEQKEELYLAKYCQTSIEGIKNFWNGQSSPDGSANYSGIGASYFCLDSSGIDILADTLTNRNIEYDARQSGWYQGAKSLNKGEVFWTNPISDAAGRGIALICAMPIYADYNGDGQEEFIGVAGSGGLIENIREIVQGTAIGDQGYALLLNNAGENLSLITSGNIDEQGEMRESEIQNAPEGGLAATQNEQLNQVLQDIKAHNKGIRKIMLDGENRYVAYVPITTTNWVMVTVLGEKDGVITRPLQKQDRQIIICAVVFLVAFILLLTAVIFGSSKFSKKMTDPLLALAESAKIVSEGDLEHQIQVPETQDEIEELSNAFNHMTINLKEYIENLTKITAEKERIGAELSVATKIQADMLPCIFPAFPGRKEFDVYATMTPAKEVGGDFYDFFLVDEDHLAMVMADVSGKGVPAALFMVIAKTLLKNSALSGLGPKEILEKVNNQLCENNEAEMFVTVWIGILTISTGKMLCANAGHEYPVIRHGDADYELYKDKHGFVLAGMEDAKYKEYELELQPGDRFFIYTDGVAEATDTQNELFGTDRMLSSLNQSFDRTPEELLHDMKKDIDAFVGKAPQFDDITMLGMYYLGQDADR